jgi:diguanylate cyclase (GGDEF)-like protein
MTKIKPGYLHTVYQNDEDRRIAQILFRIIFAILVVYLVVIGLAMSFWRDSRLIVTALAGSVWLMVPLGLLIRGYLRASGLMVVLSALGTVTVLATIGQGIHDISIIAYPVVIVIASLIMRRRDFFLSSLLTVCAMGWLVFGEAYGLFASLPYGTPVGTDFIIVVFILLLAIMAVDMLAENMRENLRQARLEISQREAVEAQLRYQGMHDALTGIYNRFFFEEELLRLEHTREFPVSIIIADIDGLKVINDTQGHAVGDELLRRTAMVLSSIFRAGDILARIGGDEFAILLPQTELATVENMLLRVRMKLTEYNASYPDLPVQLSLGASTAEHGDLGHAFNVADQNMYAEKVMRKSKFE